MPLINLYPTKTQYKFNMVERAGVWQADSHEILGCTFHSRPNGWNARKGQSEGRHTREGTWPSFCFVEATDEQAQRIRDYVENDVKHCFDMASIFRRFKE